MSGGPDGSDELAVLEDYRAQLSAMEEGDTDTLDALLDGGFTLTHISGYEQPKSEWLEQMNGGQFIYHDVREVDAAVQLADDTAHLIARIVTDATIYGMRNNWRLRFSSEFGRRDEGWLVLRTVATTW